MAWAVKVREDGAKRFAFINGKGGINYLKVHAARFESRGKAMAFIADNAPLNPGFDWRAQELK